MAWIKERPRKSGAISYAVMWRDPDSRKQESLTFHDEGEAQMLVRLLDANGQSFKIAQAGILKVHDQAPTLDPVMEQHISMLTRAGAGTVRKYRAMIRDHIAPRIGYLPVTTVEYPQLTDWIKWMQSKGCSAKTIANVHGLISATMTTAIKLKLRADNPCTGIALPRSDRTSDSASSLSLPSALAEVLRPLVEGRDDGELLFTSPTGGAIRSGGMHNWVWQPAHKAARAEGLRKRPRVHDLRHTHASWLVQEGVNIFTVSRRLGHESITTTLDRYSHIMPDALRDAAEATERAMTAKPQSTG